MVVPLVADTTTSSPAEALSLTATTVPAAGPPAVTSDTPIPATAVAPTPVPAAAQPVQFQFLRKWGSQGSGEGQLEFPQGMAVDEAGNVYVADRGNHRLQKFGAGGRHLLTGGLRAAAMASSSIPGE